MKDESLSPELLKGYPGNPGVQLPALKREMKRWFGTFRGRVSLLAFYSLDML
jgi:hypothetical protein